MKTVLAWGRQNLFDRFAKAWEWRRHGLPVVLFAFVSIALSRSLLASSPHSLEDVIRLLQVLAGEHPVGVALLDDIDGDQRLGLAEAISILQQVSGQTVYGEIHQGQYHLGPVDFAETEWHNACAPTGGYRPELWTSTGLGGEFLAGVSSDYNQDGGCCDTCIIIRTALGNEIVARVVTWGDTGPEDIDVSPAVYAVLNEGEYPRLMSWQYVKCPASGTIHFEFQTGAHIWWSSLWVRNARIPIEKVEVRSSKHASFFVLQIGSDGTYTDAGGFGAGPFTMRVTAIDGQVIESDFSFFPTGELVDSGQQFR